MRKPTPREIIAIGVGKSDEPWCEDDRQWFARNSGRRYRIRLAGRDEHGAAYEEAGLPHKPLGDGPNGEPTQEYTLVQQLYPGIRSRAIIAVWGVPDCPADELWPDDQSIIDFMNFHDHARLLRRTGGRR